VERRSIIDPDIKAIAMVPLVEEYTDDYPKHCSGTVITTQGGARALSWDSTCAGMYILSEIILTVAIHIQTIVRHFLE